MIDPEYHRLVVEWAAYYRSLGIYALPSVIGSDGRKRPIVPYREYWTAEPPADLVERHPCEALQVLAGRRYRLIVLDLDGPAAGERYNAVWAPRVPPTWISRSGGGGRHVWFRVERVGKPLPKAILWTDGAKHSAIERLGDRSIVMAPPSRGRDRQYRWEPGCGPEEIRSPAECPQWILSLPDVVREAPRTTFAGQDGEMDAVPGKIALAASWGLRLTGRTSGDWHSCHAIDREDAIASAGIRADSGVYHDFGSGAKLGFLSLAVALGAYATVREARDAILGRQNDTRRATPKGRSPRS